jgi:hypothetical protein
VYDVSALTAAEPALLASSNPKAAAIDFMASAPLANQRVSFSKARLPGASLLCDPADIAIQLK